MTMTSTPALMRASARAIMSGVGPTGGAGPGAGPGCPCRRGILLDLLDILDGDESLEVLVIIHHEEFLHPRMFEMFLGLLQSRADGDGDEVFLVIRSEMRRSMLVSKRRSRW